MIRHVPGGAVIMSEGEVGGPPEPRAVRDRNCFNCPRPSSCKVDDPKDCAYLNGAEPKREREPTGIEVSYTEDRNAYQREYRKTAKGKAGRAAYKASGKNKKYQKTYRDTHRLELNAYQRARWAKKKAANEDSA